MMVMTLFKIPPYSLDCPISNSENCSVILHFCCVSLIITLSSGTISLYITFDIRICIDYDMC